MYSTYTCKKQYACISFAESICNSCMDNSEIARYLHFTGVIREAGAIGYRCSSYLIVEEIPK